MASPWGRALRHNLTLPFCDKPGFGDTLVPNDDGLFPGITQTWRAPDCEI
jgi:hypothetical protein